MVNERSTGRRGRPMSRLSGISSNAASIVLSSSSSPSPVMADTGTTEELSSDVPTSVSSISSVTSSTQSGSTRSLLVSATMPRPIPKRSRIARCSRVWGMTPSSAATINSARSTPPAPINIVLMKRSWPGTSTTLTSRPPGNLTQANPSSMVMPRAFSSRRRSGSIPVRASISVDLPWSTWPAVPITNIGRKLPRELRVEIRGGLLSPGA